jgi:hypothetical protein
MSKPVFDVAFAAGKVVVCHDDLVTFIHQLVDLMTIDIKLFSSSLMLQQNARVFNPGKFCRPYLYIYVTPSLPIDRGTTRFSTLACPTQAYFATASVPKKKVF